MHQFRRILMHAPKMIKQFERIKKLIGNPSRSGLAPPTLLNRERDHNLPFFRVSVLSKRVICY